MSRFENRRYNVSYQSFKRRFLLSFLWIAALLFLGSCMPAQKSGWITGRADQYYASGEFVGLKTFFDSLTNAGIMTKPEAVRIDSLLDMGKRIQSDFRLSETEVRSRLMNYYPEVDSLQLCRWEERNLLEMRLINGEKRYFKNAVGNLFRLDSAAHGRKIEVDGLQVDSLAIFCLKESRKIISKTRSSGEPIGPLRMKLRYLGSKSPNVSEMKTRRTYSLMGSDTVL